MVSYMFAQVSAFYRECFRRAFRGVFWQIEKLSGGLSLLAGIFTHVIKPPAWEDTVIDVDLPMYFFLLAFAVTVLIGFITAPVKMYEEQVQGRLALEEARKPKLNIYLKDNALQTLMLGGTTSETLGGTMVTSISHFLDGFVGFHCQNIGETTAIRCRARLMLAIKQEDDASETDLRIIEAIPLRWTTNPTSGPDDFIADIPPNDMRRLWIANVRETGHVRLYRRPNELPADNQQLLGLQGKYLILVQVDSDSLPPQQVLLQIEGLPGGPPPHGGVHKGAGSVAILAQGSPRLSHPSIEARTQL